MPLKFVGNQMICILVHVSSRLYKPTLYLLVVEEFFKCDCPLTIYALSRYIFSVGFLDHPT